MPYQLTAVRSSDAGFETELTDSRHTEFGGLYDTDDRETK
jgi:hypothetical protein